MDKTVWVALYLRLETNLWATVSESSGWLEINKATSLKTSSDGLVRVIKTLFREFTRRLRRAGLKFLFRQRPTQESK